MRIKAPGLGGFGESARNLGGERQAQTGVQIKHHGLWNTRKLARVTADVYFNVDINKYVIIFDSSLVSRGAAVGHAVLELVDAARLVLAGEALVIALAVLL